MPFIDISSVRTDECECQVCKKKITLQQAFFKCDTCNQVFHPFCKGILGHNIKRVALNPTYFCSKECRPVTVSDTSNDIFSPSSPSSNFEYGKPNQFDELKKMLLTFQSTQTAIYNDVKELKESQGFLAKVFDDLMEQNKKISLENSELKNRIARLEENETINKLGIQKLEDDMDELKQKELSRDVIITGIPRTNSFSPNQLVKNIFMVLNSKVTLDDVEQCYLKKVIQNKIELLILFVRLKTEKNKIALFEDRKNYGKLFLNQIGFNENNEKQLFLRENITISKRKLYAKAKEFKEKCCFKFLWIKNGKIHLRQADKSKVFVIRNLDDLEQLPFKIALQSNSLNDNTATIPVIPST
jgi:regulator of replication initiation timing